MSPRYEVFEHLLNEKRVRFSEVSRETGVSYSTFTDWRAGRYNPKREKIEKLAAYFGVPTDIFYVDGEIESDAHPYYVNDEAMEMMSEIFNRPELKILFNASRNAKKDQVLFAAEMLDRMKGTNPDG